MSANKNDGSESDCVIVRCGDCKRVVYAAVNNPVVMNTKRYKEIGKMVSEGCTVDHMIVEQVRKTDFGCKCERTK